MIPRNTTTNKTYDCHLTLDYINEKDLIKIELMYGIKKIKSLRLLKYVQKKKQRESDSPKKQRRNKLDGQHSCVGRISKLMSLSKTRDRGIKVVFE